MGNYKFRFSDMIPNAWFHKLKNMNTKPTPNSYYPKTLNPSKKPKSNPKPDQKPDPLFTNSDQRKSYYFTRDLALQPDPPRRSSRRRSTRRGRPPPAAPACTCGGAVSPRPESSSAPSLEECTNSGPDQTSSSEPDSVLTEFGSDAGHDIMLMSWPAQSPCCICKCRCSSGGGDNDKVIKHLSAGAGTETEDQCRRLPPIITRAGGGGSAAAGSPARRVPAAGVRLRANSPRIGRRRSVSSSGGSAASSRRSVAESTAVVKASRDPRRDFRESMVEMILENDIRASNDLEELLACYLSLNSDEYHELIINVFKQIWFDFIHLRLK